jgi:hypothetical protein
MPSASGADGLLDAIAIQQIPKQQSVNEIVVAATFLSAAWITVLLRFWTRTFVVRALSWDDWTMALTVVGMSCIQCLSLTD